VTITGLYNLPESHGEARPVFILFILFILAKRCLQARMDRM